MDILLTHAYFLQEDAHEQRVMKPYPPLGLLYLTAYLKLKGFGVEVFDSTFGSMDEFDLLIREQQPRVVGIYVNLMTKFNALKMIRLCKQNGATVILGGPEPSSYAEEYLARGADVIVVGEGELTLEELLLGGLQSPQSVKGIIYRNPAGDVTHNPPRPYLADLDMLPFPDREAIEVDRYVDVWRKYHGVGSVSLICARGCPYHCQWCSHAVYGNTHRRRTPVNVADELQFLIERYEPEQVWYADDVFTIHRRWFFEYAAELKRRRIQIPFECISRADCLNEDVAVKLAEMGCARLWIGSESGSQRVLDAMQRQTDAGDVREKTKMLQRYGIEVGMFIMLGYEGESMADLAETTEHLKQCAPNTFLTTVAYPIKGTPYYRQVQHKVVSPTGWERHSDRDLSVRGRHTKRFYSFATRWMVGEVALHNEWRGEKRPLRMAKWALNSVMGRVGMALTRFERER